MLLETLINVAFLSLLYPTSKAISGCIIYAEYLILVDRAVSPDQALAMPVQRI